MKISINLEDILVKDLENVAKELNIKTSKLIEEAISYYFDKLDEKIADKRLDDLKNKKSSVVKLEDVLKKASIDV
jgi:predicted transcriptional regulator